MRAGERLQAAIDKLEALRAYSLTNEPESDEQLAILRKAEANWAWLVMMTGPARAMSTLRHELALADAILRADS